MGKTIKDKMQNPPAFFAGAAEVERLRAEAESWLGTPFFLHGTLKGQGVDCVCLVAEIMQRLGVIPGYMFPPYTRDWPKHREDSIILAWLNACPQVVRLPDGALLQAGDLACFQFGQCVHHCAVMLDATHMIHAVEGRMVERGQLDDSTWKKRFVCAYRPLNNKL